MALLGENIHQIFIKTLEGSCLACFIQYENLEHDFVYLKCRCKMCKFCIIEKVKKATEGKFILNSFEKSNFYSYIL